MQEYLDKIDAFLNEFVSLDLWKQIKEFVNRIKSILVRKGEDDAVNMIDIMIN